MDENTNDETNTTTTAHATPELLAKIERYRAMFRQDSIERGRDIEALERDMAARAVDDPAACLACGGTGGLYGILCGRCDSTPGFDPLVTVEPIRLVADLRAERDALAARVAELEAERDGLRAALLIPFTRYLVVKPNDQDDLYAPARVWEVHSRVTGFGSIGTVADYSVSRRIQTQQQAIEEAHKIAAQRDIPANRIFIQDAPDTNDSDGKEGQS